MYTFGAPVEMMDVSDSEGLGIAPRRIAVWVTAEGNIIIITYKWSAGL